jgi:hypothetical protein
LDEAANFDALFMDTKISFAVFRATGKSANALPIRPVEA